MRAGREYGLTITAFRALPEVDRLLAMGLRTYEDGLCSGCGQQVSESMDPVLAEFWATWPPAVCHACAALADAHESVKDWKHPHTARHIVGMNAGWEEARSAARSERAAPDQ